MNTAGISSSAFANPVAPLSPVGKQPVGLENDESRADILRPVEEPSAASGAADDVAGQTANAGAGSQSGEANPQQSNQEAAIARQEQQQLLAERREISELAARDREVRAHEQAHAAVGGRYAGAPSYTYKRGPDGVNYAVAGEVPISLPTGGGDPQQTLAAAEQVRRAALAPAEPSPQDRSVAAQAAQVANQARADIAAERAAEINQRNNPEEAEESQQPSVANDADPDVSENRRKAAVETSRSASLRSDQLSQQLVTGETASTPGSLINQIA